MQTILFVCTGNTCRSPMAEAAARFLADSGALDIRGGEVFFASAGVSAANGVEITPEAVEALAKRDIRHDGQSKPLSAEMIRQATLVLGLTEGHAASARALVEGEPHIQARIHRLDPQGDIDDPIGMSQEVYDSVLQRLLSVIPRRVAELLPEQDVEPMRIAIGGDHRGNTAARALAEILESAGHEVASTGVCKAESCDYPDNAWLSAGAVSRGDAERAVLICGSGIGVCIAANKLPGVRAALVFDEVCAEMSRRHNDANVLCLSGDLTPVDQMKKIIDVWLATDFDGGRHLRRLRKIAAIERGEDPTHIEVSSAAHG